MASRTAYLVCLLSLGACLSPQTGMAQEAEPAKGAEITNMFADVDVRTIFNEVGLAAKVSIFSDDSVKEQLLTIQFTKEPLERVLDKLALAVGAYWKQKSPGIYLVSKATPDAMFFREFARTQLYVPQYQSATSIHLLLSPATRLYVNLDAKTNLLSITAPEALIPKIKEEMKAVDRPSRQFVVEALVAEVTVDRNKDTGFSWSWKKFTSGDEGVVYDRATVADVARLKGFIEHRQANLRANPRVTAFEGRESELTVGQDTYYSILAGNLSFPTAQIQLIRTGVTLRFTGTIADDGTITLSLEPEVSDAVVTVNGSPTTTVRRAATNVRVKFGETIAIGGLIQESTARRVVKVPLLGSLPILGELFTKRETQQRRTETIILITPRLTAEGVTEKGMDSDRRLPPP